MRTNRAHGCRHPGSPQGLPKRLPSVLPWALTALTQVGLAALVGATVLAAPPTPTPAGRTAYLRECAGCHGESALGDGPDAPFLASRPTDLRRSGVLDTYRGDALEARIREGKALPLELRPGALRDHARDTEALYEYLVRLPDVSWERVEKGQDLYLSRCLPCHDRYGHPAEQPLRGVRKRPRDLADPLFQRAETDSELEVLVRHGKAAMPALVPRLREDEVPPLVSFVRLLSPGYELYSRYCQTCHGMDGRGPGGPTTELGAPRFAFDSDYFASHDKEQILGAMWHMLRSAKPRMPHFDTTLSRADLEAILSYLRSLPPVPATKTH